MHNTVLLRSLSIDSSNLTMNHLLTGRHILTIFDAAQVSFHVNGMTVLLSTAQIATFLPAYYTFSHFHLRPLRVLSCQLHWFYHFRKSQSSDVGTKTSSFTDCEQDHEQSLYLSLYDLLFVELSLFQKIAGKVIS